MIEQRFAFNHDKFRELQGAIGPMTRSLAFWYSDTEEAGAAIVASAMQYAPQDRAEFLETAFRAARVQLADANDKGEAQSPAK